jgi:ankyrin repeat protein
VDLQNSDLIGNTPLHIAARYNNWKCAKFLMDQGVDLNKENTYGRSPLLEAIINKNTFIAEAMVQRGGVALGTDDIADLLDVAGANGDIKTLELL